LNLQYKSNRSPVCSP